MITNAELKKTMSYCYGTENWRRLFTGVDFFITDGVVTFAEKAEAFWFVTEVFAMTRGLPNDVYEIKLLVKNEKTDIILKVGKKVLKKKHIAFTDCPEGEWVFFYTDNVFLWKDEY